MYTMMRDYHVSGVDHTALESVRGACRVIGYCSAEYCFQEASRSSLDGRWIRISVEFVLQPLRRAEPLGRHHSQVRS
jgi:hypothetical protein